MVERDPIETERARNYIDNITWRLETLQSRSRFKPATGETVKLPVRLRRFANGIPCDLALPVIELLAQGSPYTGAKLFNGEGSDEEFISTGVSIRKDSTLTTGGRSDATYTIVQDLRAKSADDIVGSGDYTSCSRIGTSEHHWDVTSVEDLPPAEQGVVYQVTGLTRSPETDLLSYQVRTMRALTQHNPETTSVCNARQTVTLESWDNVYGEPGDFRWDNGAPLAIPDACSGTGGESVTVETSLNEDCTYKVTVRRTFAISGFEVEYMRYKDKFKTERADVVDGASSGLSKTGVSVSGGVITRYESRHNEDGTWRNSVTKVEELSYDRSVEETVVTPRYTVKSRTDYAQTSRASGLLSGFAFGSYKSTATPAGRFTNEYTGYNIKVEDLGLTCEETQYLHTHETEATISDKEVPRETHTNPPGEGVVTRVSYGMDPTSGAITKRTSVRTEKCVVDAEVTQTSTLLGVLTETVSRSVSAEDVEEVPSLGRLVVRKTDGGLYDQTLQVYKRSATSNDLSIGKAVTQMERRLTIETTLPDGQSLGASASCPSSGGGEHHEVSCTVDPQTGVVRRTLRTTTEVPLAGAVVAKSRGLKHLTTRRVDMNQSDTGNYGDPLEVGESVEVSMNPGGSYNITRTTVTPKTDAGVVRTSCSRTAQEHVHVEESVSGLSVPSTEVTEASGGVHYQVDYVKDDNGVVTCRQTVTTEAQKTLTRRSRETHLETTVQAETLSNDVDAGGLVEGTPEIGQVKTADAVLTKGGNFATTEETSTAKFVWWVDASGGKLPVGTNQVFSCDYSYKIGFRNAKDSECETLRQKMLDEIKKYGSYRCVPFFNRMINDYGLYDGSIGFNAYIVSWGGARGGQLGGGDSFSETTSYTDVSYQVLPNGEAGFFSGESDMKFVVVKRKSRMKTIVGRGIKEYEEAIGSVGGKTISGGVSVSMSAGYNFRITYAESTEITASLVDGASIATLK